MGVSTVPVAVTPLPRKPIYIICAILFCEAFVSSMIFPFVNFMVKDFGIAKDEAEIGYYSGYLASSFFLGQFASSYIWGALSDKYGRRPILLVGVFGSMVSTTLFGFSPSYAWAIAIRSFGGVMNSNFAIARSYLGDITDSTNRVRGFSFVGLMWGAGAIVGPSTGGLLSNPSEHFDLPHDHLLRRYPYMLPSIVSGVLSLISWMVAFFLLKESNKKVLQRHKLREQGALRAELELKELRVASESLLTDEERAKGEGEAPASVRVARDDASDTLLSSGDGEEEQEKVEKEESVTPAKPRSLWGALRGMLGGKKSKHKYAHLEEGTDEPASGTASPTPISPPTSPEGERAQVGGKGEEKKGGTLAELVTIFRDRAVVVCILLLSLAGTCVIAIDEIFPLWAMNEPPVGIGFSSAMIGLSWAIGGITLVVFQGMVYPRLAHKVGLLSLVRYGAVGFAVVYMSFPMIGLIAKNKSLLWISLSATLFGRYVAGSSVGTTLNILVNSVGGDGVREHRGVVNGVAMSVSGLARALAPILGSSLFAWSNTNGLSFPFNHFFVFEVMSAVLISIMLLSFLIPKASIQ